MKAKNLFLLIAGVLNLFTAFVHLIGGQLSLVNPMLASSMTTQQQAEWLGGWHIISIVLLLTSLPLIRAGLKPMRHSTDLLIFIGWLYVLFAAVFVGASLYMNILAPQWILLLPIGILTLLGAKKLNPVY